MQITIPSCRFAGECERPAQFRIPSGVVRSTLAPVATSDAAAAEIAEGTLSKGTSFGGGEHWWQQQEEDSDMF